MGASAVREAGLTGPRGITRRAFVAGAAGVAGAAACGGLADGLFPAAARAGEATVGASGSGALVTQAVEAQDVSALVAGMTRREKVCQMIMPDFRKWRAAGEE